MPQVAVEAGAVATIVNLVSATRQTMTGGDRGGGGGGGGGGG